MSSTLDSLNQSRIQRLLGEAPATLAFVLVLWGIGLLQHVVFPFLGITLANFPDMFAVSIQAPFEVWRWVTAMFLHVDLTHLVKNTVPILVLGIYFERTYGRRYAVGLSFLIGFVTFGGLITVALFAPVRDGYDVVGASGIWYGLIAYGTLNRDALSIPRFGFGAPQLGRSQYITLSFGLLLAVALGYTLGSVMEAGVWGSKTSHEAHAISLLVGAVCWRVFNGHSARWLRTRVSVARQTVGSLSR